MKKMLVAALFFILGCGHDTYYYIMPSDYGEILWSGYASQNSNLATAFAEVRECMSDYGYSRAGYPHISIVEKNFNCGAVPDCNGCYSAYSYIHIAKASFFYEGMTISIEGIPIETAVLKHEMVHWIIQFGSATHDNPYMAQCAYN